MVSFGFILSCWKHCGFVSQCVKSVLEQPYPHKQIVLFGEGCFHITEPVNHGIYENIRRGRVVRLNQGLEMLSTDYISFFGVDDYLLPNVLGKVAEIIERTGYKEWYYGWHYKKDNQQLIEVPPKDFDRKRLGRENYIAGGSVFLRRDIALQHEFVGIGKGGFGDDWIMWYRVGEKYLPIIIDWPIYVERIGTSRVRIPGTRKLKRRLVRGYLRWLDLKSILASSG